MNAIERDFLAKFNQAVSANRYNSAIKIFCDFRETQDFAASAAALEMEQKLSKVCVRTGIYGIRSAEPVSIHLDMLENHRIFVKLNADIYGTDSCPPAVLAAARAAVEKLDSVRKAGRWSDFCGLAGYAGMHHVVYLRRDLKYAYILYRGEFYRLDTAKSEICPAGIDFYSSNSERASYYFDDAPLPYCISGGSYTLSQNGKYWGVGTTFGIDIYKRSDRIPGSFENFMIPGLIEESSRGWEWDFPRMEFSPDSRFLSISYYSGYTDLCELESDGKTEKKVHRLNGFSDGAFSVDGLYLYSLERTKADFEYFEKVPGTHFYKHPVKQCVRISYNYAFPGFSSSCEEADIFTECFVHDAPHWSDAEFAVFMKEMQFRGLGYLQPGVLWTRMLWYKGGGETI